ncbi:hypothetical protein [Agromyces sp. Marseille-P2726]|uniref:hypothetical protein n=1 Tax=Agromyces sp. Marseille-P2726 TaxID=2709132 RepID=UPI001570EE30|nr:hypothetical protein [Agromyces sp. Marseille-P2726]
MEEGSGGRNARRQPSWLLVGVLVAALIAMVVLSVTNVFAIADSGGQRQERIEPVIGGTPTPLPTDPASGPSSATPSPVPAAPPVDVDDDDDDDDDPDDGGDAPDDDLDG